MRASAIESSRRWFELWPTSQRVFMPHGHLPLPGEVFRQPDLARTLRSMVDEEKKALASGASRAAAIDAVRDYFYRGDIARRIDKFSRENQGLLRYEDMAAFRLQPEEPVSTTYRDCQVYKPGFWSQGPSMIEALNILEGFDLKSMGWNSTAYLHTLAEALKLAYADRDTYYGDPKFVKVPMERLLSKEYAEERRNQIGPQASQEFRPDGARYHLRGYHGPRGHDVFVHAIGLVAAVGDRRRHGHPADRAGAELSADRRASQRAGGRQAAAGHA
jgi:gamma-glutamyltranspeptidase/glutathione hydrolase